MVFKTNYNQQRAERNRAKQAKQEAKRQEKEQAKRQRPLEQAGEAASDAAPPHGTDPSAAPENSSDAS